MVHIDRRAAVEVSVTDAKAQLTELVRRAEEGEEIVLTRHGQPAARLMPMRRVPSREEKRALMESIRATAHTALPGPCAARSQDFLYDDDGLPA
jgi:prevent-host-death family protein